MICAIYKSNRKAETYLYINKRDDFSDVPQALLDTFGQPQFVMVVPLSKIKQLAQADLDKVKQALKDQGFYLQLPPPQEDLLKTHKAWLEEKQNNS
ncbi:MULTISPECIES: YcgL domain-containing protein [Ferrimonas]|uniref:YcgL domain-containing protein SAMN04488540_1139 n=1 Tax=Ferrimonas sediminum TaxID=718193 RepID=A0A1G8WBY4_9GAMM|nr:MULTISPECIES: YcgL domain-containing protein [Ferrimonas]USD39310.1 YcgL domain-containing protein [Ferrimonas sp. SCSIO 43195]SDJ75753.1 hypothetical protein SAMN04488540_1139 [Ferrimonas sediminum]